MEVRLVYFKQSGKYYSRDKYKTNQTELYDIWAEIELLQLQGRLPGLVDGTREFIILVDVPEHEYNHPHLIIKELMNIAPIR